jgi:hypothetical protein
VGRGSGAARDARQMKGGGPTAGTGPKPEELGGALAMW